MLQLPVVVVGAPPGRAMASDPGPMRGNWLPDLVDEDLFARNPVRRNNLHETLCGLPDGLAGRGIFIFWRHPRNGDAVDSSWRILAAT